MHQLSSDIRIHFVRGIPADHMPNRLISARMVFHPRIELENSIIHHDDDVSSGDHRLDLASVEHHIPTAWGWIVEVGHADDGGGHWTLRKTVLRDVLLIASS